MKTLTEFSGTTLTHAAQVWQEIKTKKPVTPESTPQPDQSPTTEFSALLKIEGERLQYLLTVLEIIGLKLNDLKRAIVFQLNSGEKAPPLAIQKEELYFLVEYYPSLSKPKSSPPHPEQSPQKKRGRLNKNTRKNNPPKGPSSLKQTSPLIIVKKTK